MNVILTLPIVVGKKYVRRDGAVVLAACCIARLGYHEVEMIKPGDNVGAVVTPETGMYYRNRTPANALKSEYDLVADYIEPAAEQPKGHVHAANMRLYSEDAAETDKPWLRWEFRGIGKEYWYGCTSSPEWETDMQYRRKLKTITINGREVPEPLRVAPTEGAQYFIADLTHPNGYSASRTWGDDRFDRYALVAGQAHLTREAAEAHARALLSFTEVKS